MTYRNIVRPIRYESMNTTMDWFEWSLKEGLLLPVSSERCCRVCHGAVGYGWDEEPYGRCQHCLNYVGSLDAVVPITYSVDSGMESLLHRYKDFGMRYRWMAAPLASLTAEFLSRHIRCLETRGDRFDFALTMPSGNAERDFDHLQTAIDLVDEWPVEWRHDLLGKARPGRPGRGDVDPSYFGVSPARAVRGANVLLFDDTWTSGSSVASAGECLRDHGARSVVALTVGRQLKAGFGTSDELIAAAKRERFSLDRCVICA